MSIIDNIEIRQNFGDKYEFTKETKKYDKLDLNELFKELEERQKSEDAYFASTYSEKNCRDLGFILFRYFCKCYTELEKIPDKEIIEKVTKMLVKERKLWGSLQSHRIAAINCEKKHFVYDYMIPLSIDFTTKKEK